MIEPDVAPPDNTIRRFAWETVTGLPFLRGKWGRRLVGGAIGLVADMMGESMSQAVYARMPGHPQQATDSLIQSGKDRGLIRFRGETDANWQTRVREAWDDYQQGGTPQQMKKVVNQWGTAGFAATWSSAFVTLTESVDPAVFTFNLTIGFGAISPPWVPVLYGSGHVYGEGGFFYGLQASTDISMLIYIVRKWKPSRSKCTLRIYWGVSNYADIII